MTLSLTTLRVAMVHYHCMYIVPEPFYCQVTPASMPSPTARTCVSGTAETSATWPVEDAE